MPDGVAGRDEESVDCVPRGCADGYLYCAFFFMGILSGISCRGSFALRPAEGMLHAPAAERGREVDRLLREGTFCLKQSGLALATAPGCGRFARSSVCYWYEGNNSFPVGKGRLLSPLLCTKRRRLPPTLPCFVLPCRLAIIATLISLLLRPVSSLSLYTSFSP